MIRFEACEPLLLTLDLGEDLGEHFGLAFGSGGDRCCEMAELFGKVDGGVVLGEDGLVLGLEKVTQGGLRRLLRIFTTEAVTHTPQHCFAAAAAGTTGDRRQRRRYRTTAGEGQEHRRSRSRQDRHVESAGRDLTETGCFWRLRPDIARLTLVPRSCRLVRTHKPLPNVATSAGRGVSGAAASGDRPNCLGL